MFFFFNDTATTEIYTLSLHDALPISTTAELLADLLAGRLDCAFVSGLGRHARDEGDRKSTRLNSSHQIISYAVFCLKKKSNAIKNHKRLTASNILRSILHQLHHQTSL